MENSLFTFRLKSRFLHIALSTIFLLLVAACGGPSDDSNPAAEAPATDTGPENRVSDTPAAATQVYAAVNAQRLLAADEEPGQWMSHGRTYDEQRFSPLRQINTENIAELGLAFYADLGTNLTQESTPLMIDGVIYLSTARSHVESYDARTGDQLWTYDPKVPGERAGLGCCGIVNRGVAAWNGKVYIGTFDGRLIALDAKTGAEVWSVLTVDYDWPYSITGAPRVVKGKVVIGNGGAELGVRGYVTAYDAETGEQVWRFYTVPGNPAEGFEHPDLETAAATWNGEWWALGGGGTVWDAIVYDQKLDLLYLGVGNGSPWNASVRSPGGGDNLYLTSIVAVNPDTGEYVWHYQQNPWESWDFTATQPIIVADLVIDGEERRVVMQAPKNGFFYVIDATNGKLISANNFVPTNWATGIDMETGRPIEVPEARYDVTGKPVILSPAAPGSHNWHPMAYSPDTGLVYIPAQEVSMAYVPAPGRIIGVFNIGVDWISGNYLYEEPGNTIKRGTRANLIGWDPVQNQEVWRVKRDGGAAGVVTTAGGIVFQGDSNKQEFIAYRADNGERIWSAPTRTGVVAGPISYELDGVQYVAQVVGGFQQGGYYAPNYSRLLVYKLGGNAELPENVPFTPPQLNPPPLTASETTVDQGQQLYAQYCGTCHEGGRGLFPDLRYSSALHATIAFNAIVLEGVLQQNGMAAFRDSLSPDEADAIRAYLIKQAHDLQEQQRAP
jgi:PQQ-dependent dehydrogenase (methanol/ethanol family)